eukprot:TRINITY_DN13730_c0_g1_i1.p1 TRINITY_DN13730_c0_g1~~TRINITY_DN13730_c0_g1_i1.p1  ORF type:complete len:172 (+),score=65.23 TRINITY_DN13730_c0_g1_i1:33-518(+)
MTKKKAATPGSTPKKSKKKRTTATKMGQTKPSSASSATSSASSSDPSSVVSPVYRGHSTVIESVGAKKKKPLFKKELEQMLYGFGDVAEPLEETVELLDEMVVEYITEMTKKASDVASRRGRLRTEDIAFVIRKDSKKYMRAKELLRKNEEIKFGRKMFNE